MHGRGGVCGVVGGAAWQERQPLQRTVRILLECILVNIAVNDFCAKKSVRYNPVLSVAELIVSGTQW